MGLREIFGGNEFDKYERQARKEEQFQNELTGHMQKFRRLGRELLVAGDMAGLRELYVKCAVDPALDEEGREWDVFGRIDDELKTLLAEYDVDLSAGHLSDI